MNLNGLINIKTSVCNLSKIFDNISGDLHVISVIRLEK